MARPRLTRPLPGVVWRGPLFDATGYAQEAREFVFGLHAAGVPVRAIPAFSWHPVVADAAVERRLIELVATWTDPRAARVEHGPVHRWHGGNGPPHIGRTMFETDRIPADWVPICNEAREVWVPSRFNVGTFAESGVDEERLVVVPSPLPMAEWQPVGPRLELPGSPGFTFLSVFDWSYRKGWDVLLTAYCSEFTASEEVALVLRVHSSYGFTGEALRALVRTFVSRGLRLDARRAPRVVVIDRVLAAADMPALYRAADCFVLPTRGEGWSRPSLEAMAVGVPVIATRWGGQLEFLRDENAYLVEIDGLVAVSEAAASEVPSFRGHRWAAPSVEHLRELMRLVYERRAEARRRALAARAEIARRYDSAVVCATLVRRLVELADA